MNNELEKAVKKLEYLYGQKIYLEVPEEDGCKQLCIEEFKAGSNYANSIDPTPISDGLDWEQRRYEIAKAAITGFRSNAGLNEAEDSPICKWSITIADKLIKQLKESK